MEERKDATAKRVESRKKEIIGKKRKKRGIQVMKEKKDKCHKRKEKIKITVFKEKKE